MTERLAMTARLQQQYSTFASDEKGGKFVPKRKRWEDLYAENRIKTEKIKITRQRNEKERLSMEAEVCTFKPNLEQTSQSKSPVKKHSFVASSNEEVEERKNADKIL